MPEMNEKELYASIRKGNIAPVVVLFGDEPYLKQLYTDRIVKRSVTDFEDFNLHRFDASVKMDDLCSAVDAMPMMSEHTCVVVRDFNYSSLSARDAEQLKHIISEPNDMCVLIFLYENTDLPQRSGTAKEITALLKKNAAFIRFERKDERELVDFACRRCAKRGANLHPTTAKYLISTCGTELGNLVNEIDKLCDYVGKNSISENDIDAVSTRTLEATSFRLAAAVCTCKKDEAMKICEDLFDMQTEPLMILGALISVFVDIYRMKLADGEGMRAESAAAAFGYGKAAFKMKNAANYGRRMSQASARTALEILRRADCSIKTSQSDKRLAVERAVIELMRVVSGAGE